jgi:hypothetical protein
MANLHEGFGEGTLGICGNGMTFLWMLLEYIALGGLFVSDICKIQNRLSTTSPSSTHAWSVEKRMRSWTVPGLG